MNPREQFETHQQPTWCAGCGDFAIWQALKAALAQLQTPSHEVVVVFDIGCAGNMADKLRAYTFHGLHGRALPVAEGIKLANHRLPVIVVGGDGGAYGEGLNHLLQTARGNHDLTYLVHNNEVYGLTKGQTSPTSPEGFLSPSTPRGVHDVPVRPLALALTAGATFVARGFAGAQDHLTALIVEAIRHPGFALVDILQPCVTFNHLHTYEWFKERLFHLEAEGHAPDDRARALQLLMAEDERLPIGIFFRSTDRPPFHEREATLARGTLVEHPASLRQDDLNALLADYR